MFAKITEINSNDRASTMNKFKKPAENRGKRNGKERKQRIKQAKYSLRLFEPQGISVTAT
jgi:hypothetical protein